MKILKFGGSSVGSALIISKVISIIKESIKQNENPIVVVSAFQGVTNLLIETGEIAASGNDEYRFLISKIKDIHYNIINELFPEEEIPVVLDAVNEKFDELEKLIYGIYLLKELSLKSKDQLMSYGEQFSALIVSKLLCFAGLDSEYFDAREVIITDNSFGNTKVNFDLTNSLVQSLIKPKNNLLVVTGFIGRTIDNETTTLGRGGSDYTASILGSALGADEIQIWTDVDGFMTADPKKVSKAIPIDELSS